MDDSQDKTEHVFNSRDCMSENQVLCTVVYASNYASESKRLWNELGTQKNIVDDIPWVILGDFNVTLKVCEHSNGSSNPTNEMTDFQDCVAAIEMKDTLSSRIQFSWTKSLKFPNCRTLKKLDRIMVNENFLDKFPLVHEKILPYIISDHSSVVILIPDGMPTTRRAFRISNFITDKKEFLPTIQGVWNAYNEDVKIESVSHYRNNQNLLLMGDGDLSYSESLERAFGAHNHFITTTTGWLKKNPEYRSDKTEDHHGIVPPELWEGGPDCLCNKTKDHHGVVTPQLWEGGSPNSETRNAYREVRRLPIVPKVDATLEKVLAAAWQNSQEVSSCLGKGTLMNVLNILRTELGRVQLGDFDLYYKDHAMREHKPNRTHLD
ncbi:RNA-directed DNA polymerase, eukaryota, Reverse transcriptase zinc-binding domain protein [Artemisia annua]|uniref:RNA-directed DNA polymerase, eukaryota, Reverse transcriptase zinc-binding domain protein n=1 Tax=Artemisia annua TaxID=35608 RepID=A0A2U1NA18_ARTAN|nr:RNA-directed DNA polymerase, eukaryota, Reverse transcriptase zinc-binding domain protein [Artemisia annua]